MKHCSKQWLFSLLQMMLSITLIPHYLLQCGRDVPHPEMVYFSMFLSLGRSCDCFDLWNTVEVNTVLVVPGAALSCSWFIVALFCIMFPLSMFPLRATISSVRFSSVSQSCLTLCDPMDCSTPGFPIHHELMQFTQTHMHRVGDAIQPSRLLLSPSPPALNPSQHQGLFQWVSSSHQVAKVLEFQLQHQSFQWTPRLCTKSLSQSRVEGPVQVFSAWPSSPLASWMSSPTELFDHCLLILFPICFIKEHFFSG